MKTKKNFKFHYFFLILILASVFISVGSATWKLFGRDTIGTPKYDEGNKLAKYFDESYSVVYNGETQSTIPSFKEGNSGDKQLTDFDYKFTKYHTKTTATPKDAKKYTVAITPKDNSNTQPLYVTLTIEKRKVKLNKDTVEIDYTGTHPTVSTILNNQFVDAETYSDGKNGVCVPVYNTDYSVGSLSNGVVTKTDTIDIGSTYTGTINQSANSNFEIQGTNFIFKYKTVLWDSDSKYYTIEDALNIAKSGTLTVKANTSFAAVSVAQKVYTNNVTTSGQKAIANYSVKPDVKLLVPYDGATGEMKVDSGANNNRNITFGNASYKKIELTITSDVTLNNDRGYISIGGVISGAQGGHSGGVAGDYAQITLEDNAKIISTGNIDAYGFIVEKDANNGSYVEMNAGTLTLPFIVVEHRGGTQFVDMIGGGLKAGNPDLKTSPFNTFYTENVRTKLIVDSGANVDGHADLYAGDQDNQTNINLVGGNTENLIYLSAGAKLISKFNNSGVTDLEIKGNAKLNHLALTVDAKIITATLSTGKVHFPISYRYNVILSPYENGNFASFDTTDQKLKILPGASLTVNKNATLTVSELTVYDNQAIYDITDPAANYPKKSENATLIINGTLNGTSVAGNVQTKENGAIIQITNNTITTQELTKNTTLSSTEVVFRGHKSEYKTITNHLHGKLFDTQTDTTMSAGKYVYVSKDQCWISEGRTATITYNFVYRDDVGNIQPFTGQVSNPNLATYSAFEDVILMEASSDGWLFDSWYSDINCSTKIDMFNGLDKANGITLYGLFEKVAQDQIYTISFDTKYNDKTTDSGISIENVQKLITHLQDGGDFDIYNDVAIQQSITSKDYDITIPYYFEQWYLDENRTTPYTNEKAIEMYPQGGETIVLYAGWSQKNTLTVNVTAKGNNGSTFGKGDSVTISISISADKATTSITGDVTGAGGDSGLFKDHEGKASSQTFVAYLLKDQSYSVSFSSSGQVKSGEASGTMGTENITVTIDNL